MALRYFAVTVSIWRKPLFRKSRLKSETSTWAAHDVNQLYELLREYFAGKKWKLTDWKELETKAGKHEI
jgi:hypothetical protein